VEIMRQKTRFEHKLIKAGVNIFHIEHIHRFYMADGGSVTMDSLGHRYTVTRWTDGYPEITTGLSRAAAEKMVADYLKSDVLETEA